MKRTLRFETAQGLWDWHHTAQLPFPITITYDDGKPEVEDIQDLQGQIDEAVDERFAEVDKRIAALEREQAETQRQLESLADSCVIDTAHIAALEEIAHSHLDGVMGWTLSKPPAPADVDLDALLERVRLILNGYRVLEENDEIYHGAVDADVCQAFIDAKAGAK
jgi:hypothetical protein